MAEETSEKRPVPIGRIVEIVLALALLALMIIRGIPTWQGQGNPVAFQIGSFAVRWYGILLMVGAYAGARLGEWEAQRRGFDVEHAWNILLWGLISAVIVSRLWYVVATWHEFSGDPLRIIGFEGGQFVGLQGLTIHGALFGAVLAVALYGWRKRLPFLTWLDIGAPAFVLGQAVGRWGNFYNMEAFGWPTTLPWGLMVPTAYRSSPNFDVAMWLKSLPADVRFHPTFLYESLFNLAVCVFLLFLARRLGDKLVPGEVFWAYGILYAVGRFFIEYIRVDSIMLGAFPAAQVVSVGLFLFCGGMLVVRRWIWIPLRAKRAGPSGGGQDGD